MTEQRADDEIDLGLLLDRLDADQRAAVTAPAGPVAIIAGAGSGKTRVLTSRIAYRIATKSAQPANIVAFTFTRQAASELQRRLANVGVDGSVVAGTFHSVAYRILRRRWEDRGRSEAPTLAPNRVEILTEQLRGERRHAGIAATEIEWARARLVSPADYVSNAATAGRRPALALDQVAKIYADFEAYKRKRRLLDFDDLLSECIAEIRRPGVAAAISWWHRHLHVDEFQDINPLQFEFLEVLRNGNTDLFIVGDPAQAIYGWNGADPGLLEQVQSGPLRPVSVALPTNYRSTPEVVSAGDRVLELNRVGSTHRAERPSGSRIMTVPCPDESEEARRIVMLATELRAPGAPWSSVAVLARTHELLRQVSMAFAKAGIPTRTVTRRGATDRSRSDLLRTARSASDSADLHAWAVDLTWPDEDDRDGEESVPAPDTIDDRLEPVRRAIETVKAFEAAGGGGGRAFAAWAELNNIEPSAEGDAVELVTMHAAKGREWPAVIVAGIDTIAFPAPATPRSPARAEEARLLYVALTRAIDRLAITWSERRNNSKAARSPLLPDFAAHETSEPRVAPPVEWKKPTAVAEPDEAELALARLRTWRAAAARAAGIPATFLLDDAALAAVVSTMPTTEAQLAGIAGIGPLVARRFAGRILPLLSGAEESRREAQ